jgi:hypothetical protein
MVGCELTDECRLALVPPRVGPHRSGIRPAKRGVTMTKLDGIVKMMEGLSLEELHALRESLDTLIHALERRGAKQGEPPEDEREVVA